MGGNLGGMHFLISAVLLGIAGLLVWRGLLAKAKVKLITDTPTSQVSRIVPGIVEVKGKVRCGDKPVVSPMTGSSCIYFRFHVEEYRSNSNGKGGSWRTVINDVKQSGCVLSDGTGEVKINLLEAELLLQPDHHAKSGTFNDASAELEAALSAYGRSSQGFIFNKSMRYTETVLREGDEVYAIGTASTHAGGGYQLSKGNHVFVVSDKPESEVVAHFNKWGIGLFIGAGVLGVAGLGAATFELWGRSF